MALYPITIFDPPETVNLIPSGSLEIVPTDMTTAQMVQIYVVQVSQTEDFALRAWISLYPDGPSLITPYPDTFAVSRSAPRALIVCLPGQIPPIGMIVANIVTPAIYYLNVLNLTNSPTAFGIMQTTLA